MPLKSKSSPLPQTPHLESQDEVARDACYDLSDVARDSALPARQLYFRAFFLLGAFVLGLACVGVFGVALATGSLSLNNAQLLVDGTILGYGMGCIGLFVFRRGLTPPTELWVNSRGLSFFWPNGRSTRLNWRELASQTELVDLRGTKSTPASRQLVLIDTPLNAALTMLIWQAPRVRLVYLTPEGFDSIIVNATRAGLRVTQYGADVKFEAPNPMKF